MGANKPPLAVKPATLAASPASPSPVGTNNNTSGAGVQKRPRNNSTSSNNKNSSTNQKMPIAASPGSVSSPSPGNTDENNSELSTSKVWILPPRPKPGRKPSVDAPPTKRKAQNRAAQRAFRERRAARVGELEEKLMEMEKERDDREKRLQRAIEDITRDNAQLREALQDIRGKAVNGDYNMTPAASPMTVDNSHDMEALDRALEQKLPVPNEEDEDEEEDNTESCNVCVKDDCICESIGIKTNKSSAPASVPLKKRSYSMAGSKKTEHLPQEEMEIDFTAMFARPSAKGEATAKAVVTSKPPAVTEKCGFCAAGTPCVCADFHQKDQQQQNDNSRNIVLPPLEIVSPSDPAHVAPNTTKVGGTATSDIRTRSDSTGSVKLPALHPSITKEMPQDSSSATASSSNSGNTSSGCSGNPGNCAQCQLDPMSTLFCTTIASRNTSDTTSPPKNISTATPIPTASTAQPPTPTGTYIPCSAAYQTLSRHKDFNRADLGQLVGKLNTRGMQVEVSSVANVLRELDRRLYEN